jgi:hypothetical protein
LEPTSGAGIVREKVMAVQRSGPDIREEQRIEFCERLRSRLPELEEAITAKLRNTTRGPSVEGDVDLERGQRESVRACVSIILMAIESDSDWIEGSVPAPAVIQAQRVARLGLSLQAVLGRYTDGFSVFWDFLLREVEAAELSEVDRAALLRSLSRQMALTVGKVMPQVAAKHAETTTVESHTRRARIAGIVEALLSSAPVATDELDYDVDGTHLCVVGAGDRAEAALRRLAAMVGGPSLIVPRPDGMVWAWLQAEEVSDETLHRLSGSFTNGIRLAIGAKASGRSGFRASHRQAQDAMQVALCQGNFVTRYADVLLLVPAVIDRERGNSLVSIYLDPLEEARERKPSMKETLRAYFETELNVSATAARLRVDRHTAATRLREIEQRLGSLIHLHHAELEIALRLDDLRKREDVDR